MLTPSPGGVTGVLASRPNTLYRVQVFMERTAWNACVPMSVLKPPICQKSEGRYHQMQGDTMIGEIEVRTDSQGMGWFSVPVPAGGLAAATATQLDEDRWPLCTSEFSPAVEAGRGESRDWE